MGKRGPKPSPALDRIKSSIDKNGPNGCWLWTGKKNHQGYGQLWLGRGHTPNRTNAHRVIFQFKYGLSLHKLDQVCHHCDNTGCVNPNHLFLGTHKDNALDREKKGRGYHPKGIPKNVGVKNPMSEMTEERVREIRGLWENGVQGKEIATRFGISRSVVSWMVNRKTYASIA